MESSNVKESICYIHLTHRKFLLVLYFSFSNISNCKSLCTGAALLRHCFFIPHSVLVWNCHKSIGGCSQRVCQWVVRLQGRPWNIHRLRLRAAHIESTGYTATMIMSPLLVHQYDWINSRRDWMSQSLSIRATIHGQRLL